MKKPLGNCKHAQDEREWKWLYSENELEDGCWVCGSELTLFANKIKDISNVGMDLKTRKDCEKNPELARQVLSMVNRPTWVCSPCQKRRDEESKTAKFIDAEEVFAGLMGENYIKRTLALINEVESCVSDCPYKVKLPIWRSNIEKKS